MGATAIPMLYGLNRLANSGGGDVLARANALKAAAGPPPVARVAPSPSPLADARAAQAAALATRRRAAGATGRSATLLTGGAGLMNEPAPQRASLLGA